MSRVTTIAIAIAWGFVVAVLLYGAVRAIQYFVFPEPNPATVVWTAHSGYFWRIWIVAFAGGIAAFGAYLMAQRNAGRVARALVPGVAIATIVVTTQGVLLP